MLTADVMPPGQGAHFFGLANVGTTGAAAAAGLCGLLVDGANAAAPGSGYTALFLAATLVFGLSGILARSLPSVQQEPAGRAVALP